MWQYYSSNKAVQRIKIEREEDFIKRKQLENKNEIK
jgi:hypothetical protein